MMPNPYEAPQAVVADLEFVRIVRPWLVTIGLVVLWLVLAAWVLGGLSHLRMLVPNNGWTITYAAYLIALMVVPAFLYVMIARRRHWARVAALILTGLDVLFRVYLTVVDPNLPASALGYLLVPALVQFMAHALFWLPRSNTWFRAEISVVPSFRG